VTKDYHYSGKQGFRKVLNIDFVDFYDLKYCASVVKGLYLDEVPYFNHNYGTVDAYGCSE